MSIDYNKIQDVIGYEFENEDLLQQAFIRKSYSEENGGQNNEVLEFIGDKALDLAVIRLMMERFGEFTDNKEFYEFRLKNPKYFQTKLKEGNFTDIKKDLVEKKALSKSMDRLGFNKQLIMGNGDIKTNAQNQDSVKEDLFEAIIGAVALDSGWDMDEITSVVEVMIDFNSYFNNEEDKYENYVGKLQEWSQAQGYGLPTYNYYPTPDGFECIVFVDDNEDNNIVEEKGEAISRAKARMNSAYKAYKSLEKKGYIENEYKNAIKTLDEIQPLRQINELVQKKIIEKPVYDFKQYYDEKGKPIWICKMSIKGIEQKFTNQGPTKKEAQKLVASEMLVYLMMKNSNEL